jgi:octanoyl-[GcvH]:protein N-octanoyltransferase
MSDPDPDVQQPQVLVGPLAHEHPALELAFAHALVRRASRGEVDEVIRVYRPAKPTVVFGRRDTKLPGFPGALNVCKDAGFATAVRATGGRAVAYTGRAVVIDHVKREHNAAERQEQRFAEYGQTFVNVLSGLGVEARLGAVPGEYCPGAHSVNARGSVKLIGTAQRVVRDAWLFSSLVIVDDTDYVRPLLAKVYGALDLPFNETSVGAVSEESSRAGALNVEKAMVAALAPNARTAPSDSESATLALARGLLPQHRL